MESMGGYEVHFLGASNEITDGGCISNINSHPTTSIVVGELRSRIDDYQSNREVVSIGIAKVNRHGKCWKLRT